VGDGGAVKRLWLVVDVLACLALMSMFAWAFLDLPFWAPLEGANPRAMGLVFFHVAPLFAAGARRIPTC
jgi:hypothetical protein